VIALYGERALVLMMAAVSVSMVVGAVNLALSGGRAGPPYARGPLALLAPCEALVLALEVVAVYYVYRAGYEGWAKASVALLTAWLALNLLVFVPLAVRGMYEGSPDLVRWGLLVKVAGALLNYLVPVIAVYGFPGVPRSLLWAAFATVSASHLALDVPPVWAVRLERRGAVHVPVLDIDLSTGHRTSLLIANYIGSLLYLTSYAVALIRARGI